MIQTGMLDLVITLSIIQGSRPFPSTPAPTLTFHSTSTPTTSMTTLYYILQVHSNRTSRSRQLHLQSTTMVHSQPTRTPQWVLLSILQSITRPLGPLIPPQHLHRNRCMKTSICTSVVRTPICGSSDPCRITLVIGPPTSLPQCILNTYTILLTKQYLAPLQVLLLHQRRILPLLLSPCNMSTLLKSFTRSIPMHNRMV